MTSNLNRSWSGPALVAVPGVGAVLEPPSPVCEARNNPDFQRI
jgi:hypothetical protein